MTAVEKEFEIALKTHKSKMAGVIALFKNRALSSADDASRLKNKENVT